MESAFFAHAYGPKEDILSSVWQYANWVSGHWKNETMFLIRRMCFSFKSVNNSQSHTSSALLCHQELVEQKSLYCLWFTQSWEWKCGDLKCVQKPTRDRFSLTHLKHNTTAHNSLSLYYRIARMWWSDVIVWWVNLFLCSFSNRQHGRRSLCVQHVKSTTDAHYVNTVRINLWKIFGGTRVTGARGSRVSVGGTSTNNINEKRHQSASYWAMLSIKLLGRMPPYSTTTVYGYGEHSI